MLGHVPNDPASVDDLGPPALLKRVGNVVEAQIVRARLEAVEIPAFVIGADAFGLAARPGDRPRGEVEVWVPQTLLNEALDLLDTPDPLPDEGFDAPDAFQDPGRPLAFRALTCAIAGWVLVFLMLPGAAIAVVAFLYAIMLAGRAIKRSTIGDRGFRLQIVAAMIVALGGLATALAVFASLLR